MFNRNKAKTPIGCVASSDRANQRRARAQHEGKKLDLPKTKLSAARAQAQVEKHAGDIDAAAKDLGVSRATLYRRLKKVR